MNRVIIHSGSYRSVCHAVSNSRTDGRSQGILSDQLVGGFALLRVPPTDLDDPIPARILPRLYSQTANENWRVRNSGL